MLALGLSIWVLLGVLTWFIIIDPQREGRITLLDLIMFPLCVVMGCIGLLCAVIVISEDIVVFKFKKKTK